MFKPGDRIKVISDGGHLGMFGEVTDINNGSYTYWYTVKLHKSENSYTCTVFQEQELEYDKVWYREQKINKLLGNI